MDAIAQVEILEKRTKDVADKRLEALAAGGLNWDVDLVPVVPVDEPNTEVAHRVIEEHEFEMLGVPLLGEQARSIGLEWLHLPIADGQIPDARFEAGWRVHGPAVRGRLLEGDKILVHCSGGLGRAGTVAARLLVELGVAARDAINRVRAVRPGAIETTEQERYVLSCRPVATTRLA